MPDENSNNSNLGAVDEELVAYLDGELPPQEAQRIENLLSSDSPRLSPIMNQWPGGILIGVGKLHSWLAPHGLM